MVRPIAGDIPTVPSSLSPTRHAVTTYGSVTAPPPSRPALTHTLLATRCGDAEESRPARKRAAKMETPLPTTRTTMIRQTAVSKAQKQKCLRT